MRYCWKTISLLTVIFFAFPVLSAPPAAAADTSVINIDPSVTKSAPAQSTASKTPSKSRADSLGLIGQFAKTAPVADTLHQNAREMFRTLGNFHRAMGIYTVSAGILAVIAGAAILDKADILPFSLSLITLGGITAGIGVWEISIGSKLSR
jgi:hypothetical protein